jgi:molybdenum cofactor biosynthesis enzyme MoaA
MRIDGFDIKSLLRSGATHQKLKDTLISLWQARDDRYSPSDDNLALVQVEQNEAETLVIRPNCAPLSLCL